MDWEDVNRLVSRETWAVVLIFVGAAAGMGMFAYAAWSGVGGGRAVFLVAVASSYVSHALTRLYEMMYRAKWGSRS